MDALDPKPKDVERMWMRLCLLLLGMTDWLDLIEDEDELGPLPADCDVPEELRPISEAGSKPESEPDEEPWLSCREDVFPSTRGLAKTLQNLALWTGEPCGGSGVFLLISRLSEYMPSFAEEILRSPIVLNRFEAKAPPNTFRLAIAAVTHFLHQRPKTHFLHLLTYFQDLLLDIAICVQPALAEMPGLEAASAKTWWALARIGLDAGPAFPWEKFGRPQPRSSELKPRRDSENNDVLVPLHITGAKADAPGNQPAGHMPQRHLVSRCPINQLIVPEVLGLKEAGVHWKDVLTRRAEGDSQPESAFAEIYETRKVDGAWIQSIADLLMKHDVAMHGLTQGSQ
ncbi:hypothetical protein DFH08DRAFT_1017509 [Mycena albidolilacea]|uniref:Uncharacterized protein n=1 Tax=Mycena albidolilacea TaxID=1033008 RepID=A0AAD7F2M9_9AGAR|nr:hypothetical protein DFH08DRAFT_1017509 [Mycena albidolilacea]